MVANWLMLESPPEPFTETTVQASCVCQNGLLVAGALAEPLKLMDNLEEPPRFKFPPVTEMVGKPELALLEDKFQTYVPPLLKSNPFTKVSVAGPVFVPGAMLPAPETAPPTKPDPLNVAPGWTCTALVLTALPP